MIEDSLSWPKTKIQGDKIYILSGDCLEGKSMENYLTVPPPLWMSCINISASHPMQCCPLELGKGESAYNVHHLVTMKKSTSDLA